MSDRARIDFPSRIGVWWASDTWPMPAAQEVARDIETMGYGSLFLPEIGFKDALIESAAFLDATERLVVGTGIANIHARIPETAEGAGRTLTALYPGRFVYGLGVSHGPLVARLGIEYDKPLATMRGYLERMAALPEIIEPGSGRPTRLLAALGPKMIELSGSAADGAHPYLATPAHTAIAREILGPDKWVVPEQAVVVGGDDAEQMRRAHLHLQIYSGLPNYRNSWKRLGFDESDFVPGGSEKLARGVVGMGSVEQAAATVTAHLDAGADHVLVQVLGDGNPAWDPRPALGELAAVFGLGA
ncbi:MAG TPA: LLM class F420-dependent oxidoreductase [Mycobacterium sp.]|nr:LLM class F420-dependent oxidoreductase [Mycobacterium sp.]HQC77731.1 LLM class F420-dependent oxidoreductase [Mycobacterium sp.]